MKFLRILIIAAVIFVLVNILSFLDIYASVRVKDIAQFSSNSGVDLIGYGLVIGLPGSGDGKGTQFTIQTLTNMLERMGITVPRNSVKVKNVAAVMVTTRLKSNIRKGNKFDVTVSSLGDATSLEGGTLLMTPLHDRNGSLYAYAQGSISIGGFNIQIDDNKIQNNHTLVGRIPNGGTVENEIHQFDPSPRVLRLSLYNPDYTTISRIKESINDKYPQCANSIDDASLELNLPENFVGSNGKVDFVMSIESMMVTPDSRARVIINEKTGTIVAGSNVTIAAVAIAHGNITVEIKSYPIISQPAAFSDGKTVESKDSYIKVTEDKARVVYFQERSDISEIASALNAIGASPRDIIAIFQALKQAGALRAELVIL